MGILLVATVSYNLTLAVGQLVRVSTLGVREAFVAVQCHQSQPSRLPPKRQRASAARSLSQKRPPFQGAFCSVGCCRAANHFIRNWLWS